MANKWLLPKSEQIVNKRKRFCALGYEKLYEYLFKNIHMYVMYVSSWGQIVSLIPKTKKILNYTFFRRNCGQPLECK